MILSDIRMRLLIGQPSHDVNFLLELVAVWWVGFHDPGEQVPSAVGPVHQVVRQVFRLERKTSYLKLFI